MRNEPLASIWHGTSRSGGILLTAAWSQLVPRTIRIQLKYLYTHNRRSVAVFVDRNEFAIGKRGLFKNHFTTRAYVVGFDGTKPNKNALNKRKRVRALVVGFVSFCRRWNCDESRVRCVKCCSRERFLLFSFSYYNLEVFLFTLRWSVPPPTWFLLLWP